MTTTAYAAPTVPQPRRLPVPAPAELHAVSVTHRRGRRSSTVLHDVSMTLRRGEVTAVLSRHDRSALTVLDLLAGRHSPDWGSVTLGGQEITRLSPTDLLRVRREHLGRVWPSYGVQPRLTVRQNLRVARHRSGQPVDDVWVDRIVDALDLHGMLGYRTVGEVDARRLRWAVARSVATRPSLVLVDDVTTRLDPRETEVLADALQAAARHLRVAVVVATQDAATAATADRVVRLASGRLADDTAA
jgi:putative ABC transport system ATP-binding protein